MGLALWLAPSRCPVILVVYLFLWIIYVYNHIYHLILFIIASQLRTTCSSLDAVQGDLMLQVCFPGHSDVGSSGPYDTWSGATKLYISSNTRANLSIVQFGHHPTASACLLSPIILLAKHSRRRARLTASRYPSTQSSEHPPLICRCHHRQSAALALRMPTAHSPPARCETGTRHV